jgi:pimeloyl-ACP methyl ester carboxylesterase
LRYHVRRWGAEDRPALLLLHGWLDTSATFADMVAGLLPDWQVLAPDWRGFGLSEWPQDGYWFADYIGDLDAIVDHYFPADVVTLIGHSMGAQVVAHYAGLRPARVGKLAILDGLMLPDEPAARAPERLRQWLDQLKLPASDPRYDSYEQLAGRIRRLHPRLTEQRALAVAHGWGRALADGRIGLCADPKHRHVFPVPYRLAESEAIWRQVIAPTLFIDGGRSELRSRISAEEMAERRSWFREHKWVVIEDCAHMLHFEAPEETARLIREFLSR